jgi:hypothetical protein
MCVSCGSIGIDEEGQLISCSQCGQSYHPYCVGFTKMVCLNFLKQKKILKKNFFLFFSFQKFLLIKVGVVLIVPYVNVVVKQLMKENFYYVMIVIYHIIHIV